MKVLYLIPAILALSSAQLAADPTVTVKNLTTLSDGSPDKKSEIKVTAYQADTAVTNPESVKYGADHAKKIKINSSYFKQPPHTVKIKGESKSKSLAPAVCQNVSEKQTVVFTTTWIQDKDKKVPKLVCK